MCTIINDNSDNDPKKRKDEAVPSPQKKETKHKKHHKQLSIIHFDI